MAELLDPQDLYEKQIKTQYRETAEKYFDELVGQAAVNVEANRETVKKYNDTVEKLKYWHKRYRKMRALKGFVIFLMILFLLTSIVGIVLFFTVKPSYAVTLPMMIGGVVIFVILLIVCIKVINKKVRERKAQVDSLQMQANQYMNEGFSQMAPLNRLFDWSAPSVISKRTTPIIQIDPLFDNEKYGYLYEKFGFGHSPDNTTSVVGVVSGSIVGNPFLLYRTLNQQMVMKTYTGSIVIHWTEVVRDSNGNSRTVHRSQTLTASVQKPAPSYFHHTELVYGNEVAPQLTFSRKPSRATDLSDKAIARKVKKGEKHLNRKVKEDLKDNDPTTNFTAMTNTKFEVLFGALDRNHESQFRLLFTPLAQNSMVRLIEDAKPYGDDFHFIKKGPLNYIVSDHSQGQDYSANPSYYESYSVDLAKQQFVTYNCQFLEALYYDLAPLLCIPLYQQYKPKEYIYGDIFRTNYTPFEEECMANVLKASNPNSFRPDEAITEQILKVSGAKKVGKSDLAIITSYAFKGIQHTDYVSVYGGDGFVHQVPVDWIEYIPVEKHTSMAMRHVNTSRETYFSKYTSDNSLKTFINSHSDNAAFQKGLIGMVLLTSFIDQDDILFDSLFS